MVRCEDGGYLCRNWPGCRFQFEQRQKRSKKERLTQLVAHVHRAQRRPRKRKTAHDPRV